MAASGVLIVNKPSGPTSFDIVAQARRVFATRQVGHAGTLDPLASGVLVVLVGEATKLSAYLTLATKSYVAEIAFGRSTDTLDAEGRTTEQSSYAAEAVSESHVRRCLALEHARGEQIPPEFSAIKVGGKTAHSLARRGQAPTLPPRPVAVSAIHLRALSTQSMTLEVTVSKGYYIRSLARDLCAELGVPGHLSALHRSASGCFTEAEAVRWPPNPAEIPETLSLTDAVRRAMPCAYLTEEALLPAKQGKPLNREHFSTAPSSAEACAWIAPSGALIAIGNEPEERGTFRVLRGFNDSSHVSHDASEPAAEPSSGQ